LWFISVNGQQLVSPRDYQFLLELLDVAVAATDCVHTSPGDATGGFLLK
jgi:hypothetical protein